MAPNGDRLKELLADVQRQAATLEAAAQQFLTEYQQSKTIASDLHGAVSDLQVALADAWAIVCREIRELKGTALTVDDIRLVGQVAIIDEECVRPAQEKVAQASIVMSQYFADRVEELLPHARRGISVVEGGRKGAERVNTDERHAQTELKHAAWRLAAAKIRADQPGISDLAAAKLIARKPSAGGAVETIRKAISKQ